MGFTGLVVSDDMEMGGILTQASMEEAAVKAVLAGTDVIEICKDPVLVLRAYEALLARRSARLRSGGAWRSQHSVSEHKDGISMRRCHASVRAQIEKLRQE